MTADRWPRGRDDSLCLGSENCAFADQLGACGLRRAVRKGRAASDLGTRNPQLAEVRCSENWEPLFTNPPRK